MMPSASNNNNNKLEKRASVSSVVSAGGGGGGIVHNTNNTVEIMKKSNNLSNNNTIINEIINASSNNNGSSKPLKEKIATGNGNGGATTTATAVVAADPTAVAITVAVTATAATVPPTNTNVANPSSVGVGTAAAGVAAVPSNLAADLLNPMKMAIVTIEHKIRNLEKRKTKLESYRAIQANGKELSTDQKNAVAKYEAVMATLEFAREFSKQMTQLAKDAEKEQKKQARKDVIARAQAETAKIREVLVVQNILSSFSDEVVRIDFMNGRNGAIKLDAEEMDALERFCIDIHARRAENCDDVPFLTQAQKAAELLSMTIDARPKAYGNTTFEKLRATLNQIQDCSYLDKIYLNVPETATIAEHIDVLQSLELSNQEDVVVDISSSLEKSIESIHLIDSLADGGELIENDVLQRQVIANLQLTAQPNTIAAAPSNVVVGGGGAGTAAVTTPVPGLQQQRTHGSRVDTTTPVHVALYGPGAPVAPGTLSTTPGGIINVAQQPPPIAVAAVGNAPQQQRQLLISPATGNGLQQNGQTIQLQPPSVHYAPITVDAVEQAFKQHQHQQFLQQMRPLADVIGSGSFYFLQDSELDSPDVGANMNNVNAVGHIGTPAFEQAQQQQQQHQLAQTKAINPADPKKHSRKDQIQTIEQQSTQPISTQTFTNQSFPLQQPQLPLQQQSQANAVIVSGVGNRRTTTPNLSSDTPSPMFQPQPNQQLFSPVSGFQQLQQQQQLGDHQQQPMMILTRLATPQARLPQQQQQQLSHTIADPAHKSAAYHFDALCYEQQIQLDMQKQLAKLNAANNDVDKQPLETTVPNEWEANLKQKKPTMSAALTNALKSSSDSTVVVGGAGGGNGSSIDTNKWSTEMNTVVTPSTPNTINSGASGAVQMRKNDWSTTAAGAAAAASGGGSGGSGVAYGDNGTPSNESNHWNTTGTQQSDSISTYVRGGSSGLRTGSNSYQRRGGDDQRGGGRGGANNGNGNGGGYRGRNSNSYGNNTQQQNGGRGNGSGIFFRNNDAATAANSSYYQNGGAGGNVYAAGKDGPRYDASSGGGGSSYRGPRGNNANGGGGGGNNNNNTRGNGSAARGLGRNGGGTPNAAPAYMNPRQSARIPLGLENKN